LVGVSVPLTTPKTSSLQCLGLSEHSCAEYSDASTLERRRLLAARVDLDAPTTDGACPALPHLRDRAMLGARHPSDDLPPVGTAGRVDPPRVG